MKIHYQANEHGRLLTRCPNGKRCLVGGGECIACEHFELKNTKGKKVTCNFKRKGSKKWQILNSTEE